MTVFQLRCMPQAPENQVNLISQLITYTPDHISLDLQDNCVCVAFLGFSSVMDVQAIDDLCGKL